MKIKNLSFGQMATYLDIGQKTQSNAKQVQRWCLPFGHPDRCIPRPEYMMRIVEYTKGQVMPNDFYIYQEIE
jgi:hypothetical protein